MNDSSKHRIHVRSASNYQIYYMTRFPRVCILFGVLLVMEWDILHLITSGSRNPEPSTTRPGPAADPARRGLALSEKKFILPCWFEDSKLTCIVILSLNVIEVVQLLRSTISYSFYLYIYRLSLAFIGLSLVSKYSPCDHFSTRILFSTKHFNPNYLDIPEIVMN